VKELAFNGGLMVWEFNLGDEDETMAEAKLIAEIWEILHLCGHGRQLTCKVGAGGPVAKDIKWISESDCITCRSVGRPKEDVGGNLPRTSK